MLRKAWIVIGLACLMSSCMTYYQANLAFNSKLEDGDVNGALVALNENKKGLKRKSKLLYHANKGVLYHLIGEYEKSNSYLEKAYLATEDYVKNYWDIAASQLSNPYRIEYAGEDHERLYLLYYKALNYLQLGDLESSLVECRRLINRQQLLADRYENKGKFGEDAFIHTLVGLIYDATNDPNNAFIAYKNALKIYENDYQKLFNISPPRQLLQDLVRAASLSGFYEEADQLALKYQIDQDSKESNHGTLVFLWHSGLSPYKSETSFNFTKTGSQGVFTFVNEDWGFNVPYESVTSGSSQVSDLDIIRVTLPRYVERKPSFDEAEIEVNDKTYSLEISESINDIAFISLQQRMSKEIAKALTRAAIKKVASEAAEKENDALGVAFEIFNAVTEKTDTRNWQSLPHSIYMARIPLKEGSNTLQLTMLNKGSGKKQTETFRMEGRKGQTQFFSYHLLN